MSNTALAIFAVVLLLAAPELVSIVRELVKDYDEFR